MVQANNSAGWSGWSETLTARTAIEAPSVITEVAFSRTASSLHFSWSPADGRGGAISHYQTQLRLGSTVVSECTTSFTALVCVNTSVAVDLAAHANATEITYQHLSFATEYSFRVRAVNSVSPAIWSEKFVRSSLPLAPAAPASVRSANVEPFKIELLLAVPQDKGSPVLEVECIMVPLHRSSNASLIPTNTTVAVAAVGILRLGEELTCDFDGLVMGGTYRFSAHARNLYGMSEMSPAIDIQTKTPQLSLFPNKIQMEVPKHAAELLTQEVVILNSGSSPLQWQLNYPSEGRTPHLHITPQSGRGSLALAPAAFVTLVVTIDPSRANQGKHEDAFEITGTGIKGQWVNLTMVVDATPDVNFSQVKDCTGQPFCPNDGSFTDALAAASIEKQAQFVIEARDLDGLSVIDSPLKTWEFGFRLEGADCVEGADCEDKDDPNERKIEFKCDKDNKYDCAFKGSFQPIATTELEDGADGAPFKLRVWLTAYGEDRPILGSPFEVNVRRMVCTTEHTTALNSTLCMCTKGHEFESLDLISRQPKCKACEKGEYKEAVANAACVSCPSGKYSTTSASTSCFMCAPGKKTDTSGAAQCELCARGFYGEAPYNECKECASGYYSNAGWDACTECPETGVSCTSGIISIKDSYWYDEAASRSVCKQECTDMCGTELTSKQLACTGSCDSRFSASAGGGLCKRTLFHKCMNDHSCKKTGSLGKQVKTIVRLDGINRTAFTEQVQESFKLSFASAIVRRLRRLTGKPGVLLGAANMAIIKIDSHNSGSGEGRQLTASDGLLVTVLIQTSADFGEAEMEELDAAKEELQTSDFGTDLMMDFNARLSAGGEVLTLSGVAVPMVSSESTASAGQRCEAGYTGQLCGVCDESRNFVRAGTVCEECWPNAANGVVVWFIVLLFCSLVVYLCYYGSKLSNATGDYSVVFRITINFVQMIGLMGAYKAGGTAQLKSFFNIASSSSGVSLSFAPIQCYLGWTYYQRFGFYMAVPFIVLLLPFLFLLPKFVRIWQDKLPTGEQSQVQQIANKKAWGKYYSTFSFLIFLLYQGVIQQNLSIFRCYDKPIDGVYYLIDDYSVACYDAKYILAAIVGVCFLVVYSFGIPFFLWRFLHKNQAKIGKDANGKAIDLHFNKCFSFLYNGYKPDRFYWEALLMFRKFGVVTVASFVQDEFYQIFFSTTLVVLFLILHLSYLPYENRMLNRLETMMLLAVYFTQISCLAYAMNPNKEVCDPDAIVVDGTVTQPEREICRAATLVTVFVTGMNVIVFLTLLGYASKQMKESFQRMGEAIEDATQTIARFATHSSHASDLDTEEREKRLAATFSSAGSPKIGRGFKASSLQFDESDVYIDTSTGISDSHNPMHAESSRGADSEEKDQRRSHAGSIGSNYAAEGESFVFTGDVNPHFGPQLKRVSSASSDVSTLSMSRHGSQVI
jgi:hypothetical protein